MFHSARWDYDYTGGDASGGLDKLADKRVALVGTGATGVQLVPHLGRDAKQLYVFQRTPSSVDERDNTPTDPEWVKSLQPGWQEERKRNFHNWSPFVGVVFGEPDLVCDFWTELGRNMTARIAASEDPASLGIEQIMAIREEEDYKIMERLRRRIGGVVADPDTAEALKPYYRFMCKRPCSSEEYLATFNRPNVTLVDVSESKGVERLTEKGIVANGVEYEVDCVIFASGFEISTEISRRYAMDVIEGRDGLSLFDYWNDSYQTLHGMTSRGFPNQFFTGFIQGGVSANTTAMFEQQAKHIAYIISEATAAARRPSNRVRRARTPGSDRSRELSIDNSAFEISCTPGYYNNEGRGGGEDNGAFLGDFYSPGFYAFDDLLAEWRAKGELEGLELDVMTSFDSTTASPSSPAPAAGSDAPTHCCWLSAERRSSSTTPAAASPATASAGPAEDVVREITSAGGEAVASTESVATRDGGDAIVRTALDHYGRIDVLVHNAGNVRRGSLKDMTTRTSKRCSTCTCAGHFTWCARRFR